MNEIWIFLSHLADLQKTSLFIKRRSQALPLRQFCSKLAEYSPSPSRLHFCVTLNLVALWFDNVSLDWINLFQRSDRCFKLDFKSYIQWGHHQLNDYLFFHFSTTRFIQQIQLSLSISGKLVLRASHEYQNLWIIKSLIQNAYNLNTLSCTL